MKNNKNIFILILVVVILIFAIAFVYYAQHNSFEVLAPTKATTSPTVSTSTPQAEAIYSSEEAKDLIHVEDPHVLETITSPVTISGEARGTWYFEASAPVTIENENGDMLGQGILQAQGDWMTSDYVPFTGTVSFTGAAAGTTGYIVLHKDNPSGLPENDQSVKIPVLF